MNFEQVHEMGVKMVKDRARQILEDIEFEGDGFDELEQWTKWKTAANNLGIDLHSEKLCSPTTGSPPELSTFEAMYGYPEIQNIENIESELLNYLDRAIAAAKK
jgi:hypothetical protein